MLLAQPGADVPVPGGQPADEPRQGSGVKPGRRVPLRIENGSLDGGDPPTPARARSWVAQDIHVEGRPEWVFVKIHTHGAPERNAATLLGKVMHDFHEWLGREHNDGRRWSLHYVTAREMYNVAMAAIEGKTGDPNFYRDHVLPPPAAALS